MVGKEIREELRQKQEREGNALIAALLGSVIFAAFIGTTLAVILFR